MNKNRWVLILSKKEKLLSTAKAVPRIIVAGISLVDLVVSFHSVFLYFFRGNLNNRKIR